MPSKRMTELSVSSAKPSSKGPIDIYDTVERRLVLRVGKTTKTWRVVYRNAAGKIQSKKLGQWPDLDVKTARTNAAAFKITIRDRIENPPPPEPVPEKSFGEIAEKFLKDHVDGNGLRSARQIRSYFKQVIVPEFEGQTFVSVRRGRIKKLLDKVAMERGLGAADMCLALIRKMANWYEVENEDYHSPIVRGMRRTKPKDRRGRRKLSDTEIRTMWRACDKLSVFGALTKMLLVTAQRRTKVATMRWSDIKGGVWTIRTAEREKNTGERLKLPQLALDILDSQSRIEGNEFVFPASREGCRNGPGENFGSYSAFGQGKSALDGLMAKTLPEMPPWRLHDLRRTARSLMSRARVLSEHAERVLGHEIKGVEGVYDVHEYDDERAEALQKLADLIQQILETPEPVEAPLPKASRSRKRNRVRVRIAHDEGARVRI